MTVDHQRVQHAEPKPGSVWIEEVIHGTCRCGRRLRRHPPMPGIRGGITWYHVDTSFDRSNGSECPRAGLSSTQGDGSDRQKGT